MLHSTYTHKDTYEDLKTSSIFENLILLPDNVFWYILKSSCFHNEMMKSNSGRLLSYEFWPHWDRTGTDNVYYVEPDLFIRFEEFDVIIEAKYGDYGGQYKFQWEKELKAYDNEYGNENKLVVFIAIGGNGSINVEEIKVRDTKHLVFKCSWLSLLISINKYMNELKQFSVPDMNFTSTMRLLDNIILAFNINGVYNIDWFDTTAIEKNIINPLSIEKIEKYFTL